MSSWFHMWIPSGGQWDEDCRWTSWAEGDDDDEVGKGNEKRYVNVKDKRGGFDGCLRDSGNIQSASSAWDREKLLLSAGTAVVVLLSSSLVQAGSRSTHSMPHAASHVSSERLQAHPSLCMHTQAAVKVRVVSESNERKTFSRSPLPLRSSTTAAAYTQTTNNNNKRQGERRGGCVLCTDSILMTTKDSCVFLAPLVNKSSSAHTNTQISRHDIFSVYLAGCCLAECCFWAERNYKKTKHKHSREQQETAKTLSLFSSLLS